MGNTRDWGLSDRWISNNGRGPYRARILCWTDAGIKMERWLAKTGETRARRERFTLTERFFLSESCGWKKDMRPAPAGPGGGGTP
jgi:hypothetical protein